MKLLTIMIVWVLLMGVAQAHSVREYAISDTLKSLNINESKLKQAVDYVMDESISTKGLVVLKNGQVMVEAYEDSEAQSNKHISYSVAKSFTSTLVGMAIDDGNLKLTDAVCQFFDEWNCADTTDPRRHITVYNLLTLTSGLNWHEDWSCPMTKARLLFRNSDAVYMDLAIFKTPSEYVLDRSVEFPAGEHFSYSTGDPALFSRIIEKATGTPFFEYANNRLFKPLGITDVEWSVDGDDFVRNYSHLNLKTKDFAKLGQLFLQKGQWQGKQLISEDWIKESTDPKSGVSPWYGYLWHVDLPVKYNRPESTIPKDAIMARGIFGQWVVVVPSLGLVVAKNASDQCALDEPLFLEKVIEAVNIKAPE